MDYFKSKEDEIAEFLSELIQVDTTNPPGNELEAAKLIGEKLAEYGLKYEILVSDRKRANIIASIKGEEEGPRFLLLSHLDVVPAKPNGWKYHPFSGLIKDGYVWGRGAIDDKGHVVVELFTLLALIENRVRFRGEVIFAATADEEKGGKLGAGWLVDNYPDKVRADYVINEGGGLGIKIDGKTVFIVQTAEKGVYWFRLKVKGKPGHASIPASGENAIITMSKIIQRTEKNKPSIKVVKPVRVMIETLAKAYGRPLLSKLLLNRLTSELALKITARKDPSLAALIDAMLRNTITPTILTSGYKENIIPDEASCIFDCRLLPGYDEKFVKEYINAVMEGLDYDLEFIQREPASMSEIGKLYHVIEKVIAREVPNSIVTPYMSTGGTDSRFFRWRFNSVAYGFQPILADMPLSEFLKMIHGVNERISIKNLVFGAKVTYEIIRELMVSSGE